MLTDPKAIEIVAAAKQKNVRDPKRSRQHFMNIFQDFFADTTFQGSYLDMGPGQYDFGVMAKERGAEQCYAIENDPPVADLGRYLGFEVVEGNIKNFSQEMVDQRLFSGVFNKFSYNCFWYLDNDEKHQRFLDHVVASLIEGGWAWIAPWNGVPKSKDLNATQIAAQVERQTALFRERGFKVIDISDKQARQYGIHGTIANNVIFTLGLD